MTDSQSTSPNAAPDSAAQTAVGVLLRQHREDAGFVVADVARSLRISQKYLEALEDGRHADLPGTAYAIGFVRSYAEHLHLDSEEIVRRYKDEAAGTSNKNDLVFPKPIADGGVPGGAVLGLGVMVAAVAYGVWYWNSSTTEVEIARVEVVPEHMAVQEAKQEPAAQEPVAQEASAAPEESMPVDEQPVATVVPSIAEPVVEAPAVEAPVAETPADEAIASVVASADAPAEAIEAAEPIETVNNTVAQAVETVVEATEPEVEAVEEPVADQGVAAVDDQVVDEAAEATAQAQEDQVEQAVETASAPPETAPDTPEATVEPVPETTVASAVPAQRQDDGPSRITVRAKSNSWIQVRDEIADRLLFTRLLREGQEYQVPNRDGLRLMTGNAGALELLVDGSAVPAIGDVGEVRRNVELDVDKLQNGSAVSE